MSLTLKHTAPAGCRQCSALGLVICIANAWTQLAADNAVRGSWPFMSLTPMLADEEAVTDDLKLRIHSDGGRGVLRPRALNAESPALKAAGTFGAAMLDGT